MLLDFIRAFSGAPGLFLGSLGPKDWRILGLGTVGVLWYSESLHNFFMVFSGALDLFLGSLGTKHRETLRIGHLGGSQK